MLWRREKTSRASERAAADAAMEVAVATARWTASLQSIDTVTLAALGVLGLQVTIASVGIAVAVSLASSVGWERIILPLAPPTAAIVYGFLLASQVVHNWAFKTQMLLIRADRELHRKRESRSGAQQLRAALEKAAGDNAGLIQEYWFRVGSAQLLFGIGVMGAVFAAGAQEGFGLDGVRLHLLEIDVTPAGLVSGMMVAVVGLLWFLFEWQALQLGSSWRSTALFGRPWAD